MKSSSARERVEEERVESRVGNKGIWTEEAMIRTGRGIRTSTSWIKMQNYKDRIARRLTTGGARDTCDSWEGE